MSPGREYGRVQVNKYVSMYVTFERYMCNYLKTIN